MCGGRTTFVFDNVNNGESRDRAPVYSRWDANTAAAVERGASSGAAVNPAPSVVFFCD